MKAERARMKRLGRHGISVLCGLLLAVLLSISDSSPIAPKMKAERTRVVTKKGSNVTLRCRGRRVFEDDTKVLWIFNSHEIQETDGNKKAIEKFLRGERKGRFSLRITNVSKKDVGNYSCLARVRNGHQFLSDEDFIELLLYKKDTTAILPKMTAVHASEVAEKGSNVMLKCRGRKVYPLDTEIQWKFNGQIIKEDTNKKAKVKYRLPHEKRKGIFSLHITNVSEKDVGEYACKAIVSNYPKAYIAEDSIELSLYNKVEWPRGTYAIPMPHSGCPVSTEFSWSEGLLRQTTEDSRSLNNCSTSFHLKREKKDSKISQHFCVKTNKTGKTQWPVGKYCIYKKGMCPFGFHEGWIKWDDGETKTDNFASGVLPDGIYSNDTVIHFCCRSDGSAETPIELPMREPFFLLKHSSSCQTVQGMRVTEEWLVWNCEDRQNKNSFGEIPQSLIAKDIRLYFCYYIKK